DRPPVEKHAMGNDVDLRRTYAAGRVWFLDHGQAPFFPARVIVARHAVARKISRKVAIGKLRSNSATGRPQIPSARRLAETSQSGVSSISALRGALLGYRCRPRPGR